MKELLYIRIQDEHGKIHHDMPCLVYANRRISLIDGEKWIISFYYKVPEVIDKEIMP